MLRFRLSLFLSLGAIVLCAQEDSLSGYLRNLENEPIEDVFIYVNGITGPQITDSEGYFSFILPAQKRYNLSFQSVRIHPMQQEILLDGDTTLYIVTKEIVQNLGEVVVESRSDVFGIRQLRSLEAGGLYEGKKTEVINIQKITGNTCEGMPSLKFKYNPLFFHMNGGLWRKM